MSVKENVGKGIAWMMVYFGGAGKYLGVASFILILATFKKTYNINVNAWWFVPFGLLAILLLGYWDYVYVLPYQNKFSNEVNDLKTGIDKINERLDKMGGRNGRR